MKKISRRTLSILLLAALIAACMLYFLVKYAKDGGKWAAFYANDTVYSDGTLTRGRIYDRNGVLLSEYRDGARRYHDDWSIRTATLHAVGDRYGNIGTGALYTFTDRLIGYNFITGTGSAFRSGGDVYLSLDADLCAAAMDALNGRRGTVSVCNYETGEILCMVSSPSFDPEGDGSDIEEDSGAYMNRFLSSAYTPGSVFKLVTLAAAMENLPDLENRTFLCEGSREVGGDTITCSGYHGSQTIEEAFANSCNCAFAELALELGADTLERYAGAYGLLEAFTIDDISTVSGSFQKAAAGSADLAWSGIGQYNDLVCPAAYLRLMTAIARGGTSADLTVLHQTGGLSGLFSGTGEKTQEISVKASTAEKIKSMMNYNVAYKYDPSNFPGLSLCAKSGTAEVGEGQEPHAWFVGFLLNEDAPLAFVVVVENGGSGSSAAGSVANEVLQAAVSNNEAAG